MSTGSSDEEGGNPPRYTRENDPFQLSTKLKSDAEIDSIPANTPRRRKFTKPSVTKSSAKELQGFYRTQNANIERFLKPVDEHVRLARELNSQNQLRYKIAVYGSFAANIVLAALQLYGAIASGSLSLFTTMADSIFDPLSNLTLLLCHKAVKRVDARKFPAGKARIETAGNICFCFLMTAVSFILISFSIRDLVEGSTEETLGLHLPSIIAVSIAFVTKFVLFAYCWTLRNQYSQIRILWEDHRNDLLINGFGILTSVGGSKLRWWIDPMGALILSVLIVVLWLKTAYSEFQLLIGVTANIEMQQLITYICKCIQTYLTIPISLSSSDTDTTSQSNDPLSPNHGHRHRSCLHLWAPASRRSRYRHGRISLTASHPRRCRRTSNQTRESPRRRARIRARRLRNDS